MRRTEGQGQVQGQHTGNQDLFEREKSFEEARSAVKNQMERIFQNEAAASKSTSAVASAIASNKPIPPVPRGRQMMPPPTTANGASAGYKSGQSNTLTRRSNSTSRNMSSLSTRYVYQTYIYIYYATLGPFVLFKIFS